MCLLDSQIFKTRTLAWKEINFLGYIIFLIMIMASSVRADVQWQEHKGNHFIIYYDPAISSGWVTSVLQRAEKAYDEVAGQIGFTRYRDYWTWGNRVPIYIYAEHSSFIAATGLPEWSQGMAVRDQRTAQSRSIVTYHQENDFLDGVLPHEISHLILRDYIGAERAIPVWFNEGVAQLQEKKKVEQVGKIMAVLVANSRYLPFKYFLRYDIRFETETQTVGIFYLQSVSVIRFLIDEFGRFKFHQLCSELREGLSFEESLFKVYFPEIRSVDDFEKKWLSYIQSQ